MKRRRDLGGRSLTDLTKALQHSVSGPVVEGGSRHRHASRKIAGKSGNDQRTSGVEDDDVALRTPLAAE